MRSRVALLAFILLVTPLAGCTGGNDQPNEESGSYGSGTPGESSPSPTVLAGPVAGLPARGNELLEIQVNGSGAWRVEVPAIEYRRSTTRWAPGLIQSLAPVEGSGAVAVVQMANGTALEISGTGYARFVATATMAGTNESFLRYVPVPPAPDAGDEKVAAWARVMEGPDVAFRLVYAARSNLCDGTIDLTGVMTRDREPQAFSGPKVARCSG